MIYQFGNFKLDTNNYRLFENDCEIPVEPQIFNLIAYLVGNQDKTVTRDELLKHIWKGRIVSDTSINNSVKSARKILGDNGAKQEAIRTVHSRGYQFVAAAKIVSEHKPLEPVDAPLEQLIAVLPFANIKPNQDSDYLGFALANQIIGDLNHLEKFAVRPAASIRHYIDTLSDPITMGRMLDVDYVISGNYLLENNVVRLNVELIEVGSNRLVWQESMQDDYSNTFALQDMVAHKVAAGLKAGFKHIFLNKNYRDIPSNTLAYEFYLRGVSYPLSNDGHAMAIEMLKKSIQLDPNYAPSYAHLGSHLRLLEQHGKIAPSGMEDVEWYYQKALELNPMSFEAMTNLSGLYTETNRIEEAVVISRRMLEANPNDANTHFALGYIYRYAGMLDEAIEAMEAALRISPDNAKFRSIVSTYVSAGKYQEALTKVYLDSGDYGIGYSGMIAFNQQNYDLARTHFELVIEIDPKGIWGLIAQLHLAVMDDDKKSGMRALALIVDSNIIDAENIYYCAHFYALLNEPSASLKMLERAVSCGYFNYPHISNNPSFSIIKDHPRYLKTLKKAKQRHMEFRKKFL
jgi:DNA-binding winged helix-turn-helix (wHTH) protein/Tfp pilus assembly protein PilF